MIYFTRPCDTASKIADYFNGGAEAHLAKDIARINHESMANTSYPNCDIYAPNRGIWVPAGEDIAPREVHQIIRSFDRLNPQERANMISLQRQGIDIMALGHAQSMAAIAQERTAKGHDGEELGAMTNDKIREVAMAFSHIKGRRLNLFEQAVDEVKGHLVQFKQAVESKVGDEIHETQSNLRDAYKRLHIKFDEEMKQFKLERDAVYRRFRTLEKGALREGVKIMDSRELKAALRVGKCLEKVGHAFFGLQIVQDTYEVCDAYKHHRPWLKMAIEDALKIGAMIAIGALVCTVFVGGGWIVVVAATVTDVATNTFADQWIDKMGNKL